MKRLILAALVALTLPVFVRADIVEQQFNPDTLTRLQQGLLVRNETGGTLAAGTLVYVSSWSEDRKRWLIAKADADGTGTHAQLILPTALVYHQEGYAVKKYRLTGANTNGSTVGNPVYLSTTAGGWTLSGPSAANTTAQIVGRVAAVSASVGNIEFDLNALNTVAVGTNELQSGSLSAAVLPITVYNGTGSDILVNQLMYICGWNAANSAYSACLSDADAGGKPAQFVATGTITNAATGTAYTRATSSADLNTNAGNVGDPVYLSTTAGTWTLTAPTGASARVQVIGRIGVKSATVGVVEFDTAHSDTKGWGTNELQAAAVTAAKLTTTLATGTLDFPLVSGRIIAANAIQNLAASGGILASNSTVTLARVNGATDKALRVGWAATVVDEVQWCTVLPADIDNTAAVTIHAGLGMSAANDTPVVAIAYFFGVGSTNQGGNTAALSSSQADKTVTITAGASHVGAAGNDVCVTLIPAAHGTDAVRLDYLYATYTRQ